MNVIRRAIWNKFTDDIQDPLYVDLGGTRMYYDEAPREPEYPYCVFHTPDIMHEFEFEEEFERATVQFNYHSKEQSPDEVGDGMEYIKDMFDWADLSVTGYIFLEMRRIFTYAFKAQPENVWQGVVRYEMLIQKDE